eukprot:SM000237S08148  [mRNA]  locus=s237:17707:22273:- [translate_table: standard]
MEGAFTTPTGSPTSFPVQQQCPPAWSIPMLATSANAALEDLVRAAPTLPLSKTKQSRPASDLWIRRGLKACKDNSVEGHYPRPRLENVNSTNVEARAQAIDDKHPNGELAGSTNATSHLTRPHETYSPVKGMKTEKDEELKKTPKVTSMTVVVRIRPPVLQQEKIESLAVEGSSFRLGYSKPRQSVPTSPTVAGTISAEDSPHGMWEFDFDYVQDDSTRALQHKNAAQLATQQTFYEHVGAPCLSAFLGGQNVAILAYGQTGAGKSYTMLGDESAEGQGLIPRFGYELFKALRHGKQGEYFTMLLQFKIEYLASMLLHVQLREAHVAFPFDREHPKFGPYVDGLVQKPVTEWQQVEALLREGMARCRIGPTDMNELSNRSHTVLTLTRVQKLYDGAIEGECDHYCSINFVDLAGSERQTRTNATGDRLKESSHINKSLGHLNEVITQLEKGAAFVSYRNSNLTWLLKESLGGYSRTTLIASVSPAQQDYDETLWTLRYAARAAHIKARELPRDPKESEIKRLQDELNLLQQKYDKLNIAHVSLINRLASMENNLLQPEAVGGQPSSEEHVSVVNAALEELSIGIPVPVSRQDSIKRLGSARASPSPKSKGMKRAWNEAKWQERPPPLSCESELQALVSTLITSQTHCADVEGVDILHRCDW